MKVRLLIRNGYNVNNKTFWNGNMLQQKMRKKVPVEMKGGGGMTSWQALAPKIAKILEDMANGKE